MTAIRNRTPGCLFVLAMLALSFTAASFAQKSIELPNVTFNEPSPREFEINDSLHFHIQSDTPVDKLRARVFWGQKQDLIDRARNAPTKSCVYYSSFVIRFAGSNGEANFGWQFNYYSLQQVSDEAFDNQAYTVVLEKDGPTTAEQFRLSPKDVEKYFQSGQEIVLIAPAALRSGARDKVENVRRIKAKESQNASTGVSHAVAAGPVEEGCIVVETKHVASAAVSELLLESCGNIGQ
ncbi:MAG TPA: hypothetical protein VK302_16565 [Terriglobales bacterium]|nr:hypothetical protein [Terriglobales bacterium]